MIGEYINRFEQYGKVTYDLILSEEGVEQHRFHVNFTSDNDTENARNDLVVSKIAYVARENRLAYVNGKLDVMKARLMGGVDQLIEGARAEIIKELYGSSD